jgi:hypothetical protein
MAASIIVFHGHLLFALSLSLSRFPNLCGPLCVDATSFQALMLQHTCMRGCELVGGGLVLEALSVSGRVGERWFHMLNYCLMLLALFL